MNENKENFLARYGSSDHLHNLIDDGASSYGMFKNPSLTKDHLDKLVNDDSWSIRCRVASNPNATREHLDKLVNDEEDDVRSRVASNPNSAKEHLDRLVNDEDSTVRDMAKEQLKNIYRKCN